MEQARRFLRLPWTDKALLAQSLFFLAAIRAGLYVLPFQTLRRLLARIARKSNSSFPEASTGKFRRVIWAVTVASRHLPSVGTCLMQALAAHVMLGRRHCPTQVHIGVTRDKQGKFLGHAWLESNGVVVIGAEALKLERYTPLLALEQLGQ
jgi:Transglutaminase-like superfamily